MRSVAVQSALRASMLRHASAGRLHSAASSILTPSHASSTSIASIAASSSACSAVSACSRSYHTRSSMLLAAKPKATPKKVADPVAKESLYEFTDSVEEFEITAEDWIKAGEELDKPEEPAAPLTRSQRRRAAKKYVDPEDAEEAAELAAAPEFVDDEVEEDDEGNPLDEDPDEVFEPDESTPESKAEFEAIMKLDREEPQEYEEGEFEDPVDPATLLAGSSAAATTSAVNTAAGTKKKKGGKPVSDIDPLSAFLAALKMTDHADKFGSMDDILAVKTRDLKEYGLTVQQRKRFLKLVDRLKAQMRANTALALIRANGLNVKPKVLQKQVYDVMFGHVYEVNDVRAANKALEAAWRAPITAYREKRLETHSNLRGIREPELMEMAKIEAFQINAAREYLKKVMPPKKDERIGGRRAREQEAEEDEQAQEALLDPATRSQAEAMEKMSEEELEKMFGAGDASATPAATPAAADEKKEEAPKASA